MIDSQSTRIAFFGGAANEAATAAVVALAEAGFHVVAGAHEARESVPLRAAGIPFENDRQGVLRDSQVVITCVHTPEDVEELYLGDNGLLELMTPGTYAIDLSFSLPQLAREIYAMAAISDIEVLDAPITMLGEHGQSVMFVGGTRETRNVLSPLFPFLASIIMEQREPGEGQFAATLAYIALAGSLMGTVEALSLARVANFPQQAALNTLASTVSGSRALVEYAPHMISHEYSGALKVGDFTTVLGIALDAADALDVTVPMVETASQLYELLSLVGGDDLSIEALALLYEDEQTCSEHGLDWTLADVAEEFGDDEDDDYPGPGAGRFAGPRGPHPGADPTYGGFFSKN